jgi:hypothetical protein
MGKLKDKSILIQALFSLFVISRDMRILFKLKMIFLIIKIYLKLLKNLLKNCKLNYLSWHLNYMRSFC